MFVFRIEDDNGKGPWTSDHGHIHKLDGHPNYNNTDKYPCLYVDFKHALKIQRDECLSDKKYKEMRSYYCGVRSLKELLYWFPVKVLHQMNEIKSEISIYKIHKNSVKFGKKQIMFKKDKAKLIKRICPKKYEIFSAYAYEVN